VPEDVRPAGVQPLGNYAVQITWQDGFNQARARRFASPWLQAAAVGLPVGRTGLFCAQPRPPYQRTHRADPA